MGEDKKIGIAELRKSLFRRLCLLLEDVGWFRCEG